MIAFLMMPSLPSHAESLPVTPDAFESDWVAVSGDWTVADGALEQKSTDGSGFAFCTKGWYGDVRFSAEFQPLPDGDGVKAAILACGSTGSRTFYWGHFDSKNRQVILVRSDRNNSWNEITRKSGLSMPVGEWSRGEIRCEGEKLTVLLNDEVVLEAEDATLAGGCVGLGTSQGNVLFRNLQVEGQAVEPEGEWHMEKPPYVVVCSDAGAGGYEAFPDVVRLKNGDLICVLYAGYGHVSLPNEQLPKGGRVCAVRSTDEGETWSEAWVVYDDDDDNRDPHIAQLSDGTLVCTFFSLYPKDDHWGFRGTKLARSFDDGKTWETEATMVSGTYPCSAPVREQPDGSLVLGLYTETPEGACGAVAISEDKGLTWSDPIDIDRNSGHRHDAETDTVRLKNGDLLAVMRPCMCYAISKDGGRTWSKSQEIGFPGHAAYFLRHSSGTLLVAHRLPGTALHYTSDEGETWHGPVAIDTVGGAYPGMCELPDGRVFCVYYEEGAGSSIRGKWLEVSEEGVRVLTRD